MPAIYTGLRDKIVLLTGIGQVGDQSMWGNGAATAKTLAQSGAKIFGCDLYLEAAQHTKSRIEKEVEGAEVEVVAADVTKSDQVKSLVEKCMERFGRVDILVNNVGRSDPGGPVEISEEVSFLGRFEWRCCVVRG
jgi:NAD(P)-dependent dehydrogenase (short-subunit alcohol dehydrogenase family)